MTDRYKEKNPDFILPPAAKDELEEMRRKKYTKELQEQTPHLAELCSNIYVLVKDENPDISMAALVAVTAMIIKEKVHPSNYMEAIGQYAQSIHKMIFPGKG